MIGVQEIGVMAGDEALLGHDEVQGAGLMDRVIDDSVAPVAWRVEPGLAPYAETVAAMERHAAAIAAGAARERIWLVEHPLVITAGTSARSADLRDAGAAPVVRTGRGGQYTLHGPGQRVVYVMLDLNRRGRDVRRLVAGIEQWMIAALARLGVAAFVSPIGTGIWVGEPPGEAKIGAIGIRVRRWVAFHGAAVNLSIDLAHYRAIVPCGIADRGVARLADLRPDLAEDRLMPLFDAALLATAPDFLSVISEARAG